MIGPPMCYNCRRQNAKDRFKCEAFPDGIPADIFESRFDHNNAFPGDRGLRFEPIDPKIELPTIGGETDEGVFL